MTKLDDAVLYGSVLTTGVVMLWHGCLAQKAHSQDHRQLTPTVALARLCISEAGWDCFTSGDGLAIHEVISRGSERQGVRYTSYARAYAQRLFGARPHDVPRLRWVGQINEACDEPSDWPTTITSRRRDGTIQVSPHAPWSAYRAQCQHVMTVAAEISRLTIENVSEWSICSQPVHDWGGHMDRARAERIGLVPVDCLPNDAERTHNDFYCRPSLDASCVEVDRD